MKSRRIASLTVSSTGLGSMNLSSGYGDADEVVSAALLTEALDIGVTFLDTAHTYGAGHSETFLGKVFANIPLPLFNPSIPCGHARRRAVC